MKESQRKNLIEAFKNPPPERLAKIEYQSHFLQALGIIFACSILIYSGFWYIIFALIFGVGISYSQGIAAYNKYKTIMQFKPKENPISFEKEKSPTRRKQKINTYIMGKKAFIICSILSVIITLFIVDPTWNRWILMFIYPITISLIYVFIYYYPLFEISNFFYKRRLKGGLKNG